MSTQEGPDVGLILSQPGSLSKIGIASLASRARKLLQSKEEAESWLRNGLDLVDTACLLPGRNWSIPDDQPTKSNLPIVDYVKQITSGIDSRLAAENLGMTPDDEWSAWAEIWQDETMRAQILTRRENVLKEAFRCFEMGSELDPNNAELMYSLAESFHWGDGVQQCDEKAAALYQQAAELGHSDAQHRLSDRYFNGEGVNQDHAQAVKWLLRAAELGNIGAQYDLGLAYKYARGVPHNPALARLWFRKAAAQTRSAS